MKHWLLSNGGEVSAIDIAKKARLAAMKKMEESLRLAAKKNKKKSNKPTLKKIKKFKKISPPIRKPIASKTKKSNKVVIPSSKATLTKIKEFKKMTAPIRKPKVGKTNTKKSTKMLVRSSLPKGSDNKPLIIAALGIVSVAAFVAAKKKKQTKNNKK